MGLLAKARISSRLRITQSTIEHKYKQNQLLAAKHLPQVLVQADLRSTEEELPQPPPRSVRCCTGQSGARLRSGAEMVFSTQTYIIKKSMGQITCTTQEVSPLTELSPQLLFWSVNLPILNTLELTSKYTTECSRIHGSQAHDNRCITGPTSNQREN